MPTCINTTAVITNLDEHSTVLLLNICHSLFVLAPPILACLSSPDGLLIDFRLAWGSLGRRGNICSHAKDCDRKRWPKSLELQQNYLP